MPVARFQMPDGRVARFEVPEGTTPEQAQSMISAQMAETSQPAAKEQFQANPFSLNMDRVEDVGQSVKDAGGALVRSGTGLVSNLMRPFEAAFGDSGPTLSSLVTGQQQTPHEKRMALVDKRLRAKGYNPDSAVFQGTKVIGDVALTAPVGGAISKLVPLVSKAPAAVKFANAIQSAGFRTGAPAATSLAGRAADMGIRSAGGAVTGGAMTALVDPENAGTGAMIGAALPPALKVAGNTARAAGRVIAGPKVAEPVRQAVEAARGAGYVIPPSQAKPTLVNRALEGFSGKITTAQNASARNQGVTNRLAQKAIGAPELSEAGLAQVRQNANAAYDALGSVGAFKADNAFIQALDKAGASTASLRQNFPELVNSEVDDLIAGLKSRATFDAQPTIEAIKQFRASASANRIATDPAKKALGRAQSKIAESLEDLIDRNLQQSGQTQLLTDYRNARQTLAKVYDVEKALNATSGNVDAKKLADRLAKGRPLSGELRQIAEFGAQFPKAVQTVERMGSLPQVSPLDFGALGTVSALTSNPALMAGVLARPAARQAVLSNFVQNGLTKAQTPGQLQGLLSSPELQQLLYRSAPVVTSR